MPDSEPEEPAPMLGIRRWGDPCFHAVEEEVPEGYILDGILVRREDVMEVRVINPMEKGPIRVLKPPQKPIV